MIDEGLDYKFEEEESEVMHWSSCRSEMEGALSASLQRWRVPDHFRVLGRLDPVTGI
jgi:hypothetical protein